MQTRRLRIGLMAALLAVLALALAACGGSGSSNASASSNARSSFAAYAQCLRDHGVKLPSFGGGGGSAPPSNPPSGSPPQNGGGFRGNLPPAQRKALQSAQAACSSLRPQFPGGGGRSGGTPFNS